MIEQIGVYIELVIFVVELVFTLVHMTYVFIYILMTEGWNTEAAFGLVASVTFWTTVVHVVRIQK